MINLPSVFFSSHFLHSFTFAIHRIWSHSRLKHLATHTPTRFKSPQNTTQQPTSFRSHSKLPPFKSTIGLRKSFTRRPQLCVHTVELNCGVVRQMPLVYRIGLAAKLQFTQNTYIIFLLGHSALAKVSVCVCVHLVLALVSSLLGFCWVSVYFWCFYFFFFWPHDSVRKDHIYRDCETPFRQHSCCRADTAIGVHTFYCFRFKWNWSLWSRGE